MLKKYFSHVPLWLCIIVNAAAGMAFSGLLLAAIVYTFGLFAPPSDSERLLGILMFAAIIFGIIAVNAITFFICKKMRKPPCETPNKKKIIVRGLIIAAILALTVLSFFLLPDLWLLLNGWWF